MSDWFKERAEENEREFEAMRKKVERRSALGALGLFGPMMVAGIVALAVDWQTALLVLLGCWLLALVVSVVTALRR